MFLYSFLPGRGLSCSYPNPAPGNEQEETPFRSGQQLGACGWEGVGGGARNLYNNPCKEKKATQEPSFAFFMPQFTLQPERRNMITNRNLSISVSGLRPRQRGLPLPDSTVPLYVPGLHPTLSKRSIMATHCPLVSTKTNNQTMYKTWNRFQADVISIAT